MNNAGIQRYGTVETTAEDEWDEVMAVNLKSPNLGPRLSIVDAQGKRVARLGGEKGPGLDTGKFLAPHGLALDSRGDIYVGEVGVTNWKTSFPGETMPTPLRCLQKLERVS